MNANKNMERYVVHLWTCARLNWQFSVSFQAHIKLYYRYSYSYRIAWGPFHGNVV